MARKQQQTAHTEHFANSLCRDAGHDWRSTTSEQYRVCQREQCKTVQRLQDGQWRVVTQDRPWNDPLVAYRKQHALPQQSALFS